MATRTNGVDQAGPTRLGMTHGKQVTRRAFWARAAILACTVQRVATAQDAGVELRVASNVLEVGEAVEAQLICTNIPQPDSPQFSSPAGLRLELLNPAPSQSSLMSIVNGRAAQRTTYTYALRLTALKEGTYAIGPVQVTAGGATYPSNRVNVTVKPPASTSQPEGDRLVFVRLDAAPKSLYVTQAFKATLTIGLRKVYIQDRVVEYSSLLRAVDASASTLDVFGPQFTMSEQTLADSSGQKHQYVLYRDTQEVRAEEVGIKRVGPIFVKAEHPTALRRSFWGGGLEPSRTQPVTARAEGVEVEIKGPPTAGRPPEFAGAIGRYAILAAAQPARVEQGQPVTLTVTIHGDPVDGVAGPNLSTVPELVTRFDFSGDEWSGDVERDRVKIFRRAIFPKQQGEQNIPPIRWAYFDPTREQYVALATEPIAIVVDPPSATANASTPAPTDAATLRGAGGLTVLHGGISPNYTDVGSLLANGSMRSSSPRLAAAVTLPPLAYVALALAARHRRRLRSDAGFARRRQASRRARANSASAMREPEPSRRMIQLGAALGRFISDHLNLPPGELTPADAEAALLQHGAEDPLAREAAALLSECDTMRFAPGLVHATRVADVGKLVNNLMTRIERLR
ncbi:MAG: BatD family protein [Planctomycetota bacterium]